MRHFAFVSGVALATHGKQRSEKLRVHELTCYGCSAGLHEAKLQTYRASPPCKVKYLYFVAASLYIETLVKMSSVPPSEAPGHSDGAG